MPMGWVMVRRIGSVAAACAALLAAAVPAQASTLYTILGHGYGHGIGMSQYGTLGYALHGYSDDRILAHYFSNTTPGMAPSGVVERVLLESNRTVSVSASASITFSDEGSSISQTLPAGAYRVRYGTTPGRLQVVDASTNKILIKNIVGPLQVHPSSQPLQLNDSAGIGFTGDHWNGWFRIIESGSSLLCVDNVQMENYVAGVVPNEMPSSWPAQALRTQAVATRSYAFATRRPGSDFDAYSDTRSQVYGPIERMASSASQAVADTAHQVVMYGGTIATTFFSSSSGGRTSSEQASWGSSTGQPYLIPVSDPYDNAGGANPYHTWRLAPHTRIGLARLFGYTSRVNSIDQTYDPPSLREQTLTLHTAAGDHTWGALGVQSRLGLRSTYFRVLQVRITVPGTPVKAGTTFTMTGRVWPRPSGTVTLLRMTPSSTSWEVAVSHVPLDSTGLFSLRLTPTGDRTYRLRLENGAYSPVVHLTVTH
jgi:stage II sporulation protein D